MLGRRSEKKKEKKIIKKRCEQRDIEASRLFQLKSFADVQSRCYVADTQ